MDFVWRLGAGAEGLQAAGMSMGMHALELSMGQLSADTLRFHPCKMTELRGHLGCKWKVKLAVYRKNRAVGSFILYMCVVVASAL